MGVEFYRCKKCHKEVNDSKGSYDMCSKCKDVYCNDCNNPMTRYASVDWRCMDCDPYSPHYSESEFIQWVVDTYLPKKTACDLRSEFITTLPRIVLQCDKCQGKHCHNRNKAKNEEGHMTVGWCCKCIYPVDKWCRDCLKKMIGETKVDIIELLDEIDKIDKMDGVEVKRLKLREDIEDRKRDLLWMVYYENCVNHS